MAQDVERWLRVGCTMLQNKYISNKEKFWGLWIGHFESQMKVP
jgi:hypothetical protein